MDTDLHAEFRLSSSSLPLVDLAAAIPDARFELQELLRPESTRPVLLCWIDADSYGTAEATLEDDPAIEAWSLFEATKSARLYRLRLAPTDVTVAIGATFIDRGTTPVRASITADGWLMRARFPDRQTLRAYRDSCTDRGIGFALERLYEPEPLRGEATLTLASLTPKQREALTLAYENGYYDIPRKTTPLELGNRLEISRRSLSERLRRAEQRLVETAMTNERLTSRTPKQS
ncbi:MULTISPECIES: helix-turn-helix domain-containing protein [Natrialbaceae]|uniref:helix-turn-helix domain-containing protein n=1 Tax=Natrialbaceae TaxID=1644061 RepID=UPI00207D6236|nr:helix-turn-helix domain-containing protein [Natronococcus sp. CG52]